MYGYYKKKTSSMTYTEKIYHEDNNIIQVLNIYSENNKIL